MGVEFVKGLQAMSALSENHRFYPEAFCCQ